MNICDMAEVVINANLVFPSLLILFDSTAWGCIHAKVIQLYECIFEGYVFIRQYDLNFLNDDLRNISMF